MDEWLEAQLFPRRRRSRLLDLFATIDNNSIKMKTYVFDLDGTLCINSNGEYHLAKPFLARINFVNQLFMKDTISFSIQLVAWVGLKIMLKRQPRIGKNLQKIKFLNGA